MSACNDQVLDRYFGRVWGGIVLPEARAGFVVIVGEESFAPFSVYWLAEYSSYSASDLLKTAADLQSRYIVAQYVGRLTATHENILRQFNIQSNGMARSLFISKPPFEDESGIFYYHLNCLQDRLMPTQKSFFLGKSSLSARLVEIPTGEIGIARDLDWPEIAAFSYVIAGLTTSQPAKRQELRVEAEFDPLSFQ